jgi:hypothetical protein
MALHTRNQFTEVCGLNPRLGGDRGIIGKAIERGNIILTADGFIDDHEFKNVKFLEKYQIKAASRPPVVESEANTEGGESYPLPEQKKAEAKQTKKASAYAPKVNEEAFKLDRELKVQELEKKAAETRLLHLKEQKLKGEVVPIDLIRQLFTTHAQSVITSQKDGLEELLINITQEYRLSSEQLARLRGKMTQILNNAVDKAGAATKRTMKTLVDDFAVKREVGEHD